MKLYSLRLNWELGALFKTLAIIIYSHISKIIMLPIFRSFVCYVDHGIADGQKTQSHCTIPTLYFISLLRKKEKLNIDLSCKCMSIEKCSSMKRPIKLQKKKKKKRMKHESTERRMKNCENAMNMLNA